MREQSARPDGNGATSGRLRAVRMRRTGVNFIGVRYSAASSPSGRHARDTVYVGKSRKVCQIFEVHRFAE